MAIALYPGSFDPLTNGHLSLIQRGLQMFDKVIVAIASNPKKTPLFSVQERRQLIRDAVNDPRVEIDDFQGLLVEYAQKKGIGIILRGLRAAHALMRGESVFDSRPGALVVDVLRAEEAAARPLRGFGAAMLTERENQVLRLLAVGMSNREIGRRLVISEATVKFHVRNLRDKLEVRRRTEIVYTATRQGIV